MSPLNRVDHEPVYLEEGKDGGISLPSDDFYKPDEGFESLPECFHDEAVYLGIEGAGEDRKYWVEKVQYAIDIGREMVSPDINFNGNEIDESQLIEELRDNPFVKGYVRALQKGSRREGMPADFYPGSFADLCNNFLKYSQEREGSDIDLIAVPDWDNLGEVKRRHEEKYARRYLSEAADEVLRYISTKLFDRSSSENSKNVCGLLKEILHDEERDLNPEDLVEVGKSPEELEMPTGSLLKRTGPEV